MLLIVALLGLCRLWVTCIIAQIDYHPCLFMDYFAIVSYHEYFPKTVGSWGMCLYSYVGKYFI